MTVQSGVAEATARVDRVEVPNGAADQGVAEERVHRRARLEATGATVLAVFAGYAGLAVLAWESFDPTLGPAFFYPSAGVPLAAFILSRRTVWPGIAGAVIVAELAVDAVYGNPIGLSVAYAVSNVVEPLVGASLVLAWCGGRPDLRQRRDFRAFIVGACLIGPAVGGLIGGTAKAMMGGFPWLGTAATWASGDALGVLVVASPILLWAHQSDILRRHPWNTVGLLVVTAALSVGSYWSAAAPPSMLILPVLAWAAFRLDMLGAALGGAVAAFLGTIMTTRGYGLFGTHDVSPAMRLWLSQAYAATITVVAMLVAREAGARLRAVEEREAERRERLRLESLSRLAHQLSAALTPDDIGRALVGQMLNEAGAQALTMGLLDPEGQRLECVTMAGFPTAAVERYAETGMPMSESGVATDVVRSGTPMEFHSFAAYRHVYPDTGLVAVGGGADSIVGWPLSYGGEPFGVLVLSWPDPSLDTAQRSYISAVATMVSQALVRAKVYADQHARAGVLRTVAQPVARVDVEGLEYRAVYQPADGPHGVGGDWYSVMALPDGKTYLAVGDVMGHGLASVQDMAQLRSAGNAYAHKDLSPAEVLTDLNCFAFNQIRGEFATNLIAVFDPDEQSLTYSSAGHLPGLLRRAQTGEVVRLSGASGAILGPFEDSVYEQCTVAVGPGDVLVMYTDGLVEHHTDGLMAGIAHLEQVVAGWSPDALLDCEALARAVVHAPGEDDICLLVVRFGPDGAK